MINSNAKVIEIARIMSECGSALNRIASEAVNQIEGEGEYQFEDATDFVAGISGLLDIASFALGYEFEVQNGDIESYSPNKEFHRSDIEGYIRDAKFEDINGEYFLEYLESLRILK